MFHENLVIAKNIENDFCPLFSRIFFYQEFIIICQRYRRDLPTCHM